MRRSGWRDVLVWRAGLAAWWTTAAAMDWCRLYYEELPVHGEERSPEDMTLRLYRYMSATQQLAAHGDVVWVASEIIDLAGQLADSMPDDVTLIESDLLDKAGVFGFEQPIVMETDHGSVPIHAMTWFANEVPGGHTQIGLGFYSHRTDYLAEFPDIADCLDEFQSGAPLLAVGVGSICRMHEPIPPEYESFKLFVSILLLCGQRITLISKRHPDRAARRQGMRRGEADVPPVTLITLRRAKHVHDGEGGEHRDVDWSHRWIVAAHWREQWYPSLGEHRTIPIASYVKGPDDKPLVVKDRVYQFVR